MSKTKRVLQFVVTILYGPKDDMQERSMDPETLRFAMQVKLVDEIKKKIPLDDTSLRGIVAVRTHDYPPLGMPADHVLLSADEYFRHEAGEM